MDNIAYKPEPQLKRYWNLLSFIFFLLIALVLFTIMLFSKEYLLLLILITPFVLNEIFYLWYIAAFFKSLEYRIERDGVKAKKGVFWRKKTAVPYHKITNIDITQGPLQRLFGLSSLHIQTAGVAGPEGSRAELLMCGMHDCDAIKELIMSHIQMPDSDLPQKPIAQTIDNGIFQAILEELTKIRKKMENN
ncbi:MAG: PH domain-containing protein [Candidatus Cloacimonetes bacterium]|nr:PH domain-containing protein [Candidatus Cloacimonadota bacterium]